ncbi:MAG: DUF3800 domain-containing protein [Geobacter sp.]|nr:MAG: DUF3800 domain-containing protein [Geobacter sp.]
MSEIYNIYCDESCHLENDGQPVMLLGSIWCPLVEVQRLAAELRDIKNRHKAAGELKWTKVSAARQNFYSELVNWFLAETPLHFRALVVLNKQSLDHACYNQGSHDEFYYKMYFSLLNKILSPDKEYNIYLDVKDTRSSQKVRKLSEVLCNNVYDFTSQMIRHIQNIHSCESDLMQLADFLLGAVSYRHRGLSGNAAKVTIIELLEQKLGRTLLSSTPLREEKFNLFLFTPRLVK